jgi:hypothetical protein
VRAPRKLPARPHHSVARRGADALKPAGTDGLCTPRSFFLVLVGLGTAYSSAVTTSDLIKVDRQTAICLAVGLVRLRPQRRGRSKTRGPCLTAPRAPQTYGTAVYSLSFPSANKNLKPNTRQLNPAVTVALFAVRRARRCAFFACLTRRCPGRHARSA